MIYLRISGCKLDNLDTVISEVPSWYFRRGFWPFEARGIAATTVIKINHQQDREKEIKRRQKCRRPYDAFIQRDESDDEVVRTHQADPEATVRVIFLPLRLRILLTTRPGLSLSTDQPQDTSTKLPIELPDTPMYSGSRLEICRRGVVEAGCRFGEADPSTGSSSGASNPQANTPHRQQREKPLEEEEVR